MDKDDLTFGREDAYRVFIPIEDHEVEDDLLKSVEADENGDYIVQGIMTSDAKDEEDDSITPDGMDCSYFLEKGWIKYEHGNKPEQFIGEPLEVKVGQFNHPTTNKSVNGIFVKGRLFAQRQLTKSAVQTIEDLQKSHTKRRMGWSIEGNVKERCRKSGKIIKSVLRNVVLTMNPVNTTTWAELSKSFAKDHELTIDMGEPVQKAMDIAGAQAITPQSIEGYSPDKDPQQEWVDMFRAFVKKALTEKAFKNEFVTSSDSAETLAFVYANIEKGLDYEEADEFASYIAEKHSILKSMVINFGGENMSEKAKNSLASLLDADLEELQKSLQLDSDDDEIENEDEVEEELQKSVDTDEENSEDEEDEIEKSMDNEDGEDEDEDSDEEDEDDEEVEKSIGSELQKSMSDMGHGQAFEVSSFLSDLVDEIGFSMSGFEKSMGNVTKQQNAIVKSLTSIGQVMQGMANKIESQETTINDLQKSLGEVMNRPVGRKSVVNSRDVQTLSKSLGEPGRPLSRAQIGNELMKSFEAGEIEGSTISRFEGGVPLENLRLPAHLRTKFGLE